MKPEGIIVTRILIRTIVLAGLVAGLSGCIGVDYYAQSLKGHAEIMAARKDVGRLIADPATPDGLRAAMIKAAAIRDFASDRLALPDNASYRSYVDIGREFVTWTVFAAPEFALTPRLWCFPMFGCVPYRGYFSKGEAVKLAQAQARQGLDVHVAGVTAYSTLGWTSDPLISPMFHRDESFLAALVFHELAHQRLYFGDDTAFNEAFAVAVETSGVKAWLGAAGDKAAIRRYETGLDRQAGFVKLLDGLRAKLAGIYGSAMQPEHKRAGKAEAIERFRARYQTLRDNSWGGYAGYDAWVEAPINNAKLAASAVYSDLVPAFLRLFDLCGGDYPRFYAAAGKIGRLDRSKRAQALQAATRCE